MRAKMVDKSELKKSPLERQAEALLGKLTVHKAIEIMPDSKSPRTVRRAFNKAAGNMGLDISIRTRGETIFVILKSPPLSS